MNTDGSSTAVKDEDVTPQHPFYDVMKFAVGSLGWGVRCNEGWRQSIVCTGMYQWAAEWLADELQGKPFAPDTRPGSDPGETA